MLGFILAMGWPLLGPLILFIPLQSEAPLRGADAIHWIYVVVGAGSAVLLYYITVRLADDLSKSRVGLESAALIAVVTVTAPAYLILVAGTIILNLAAGGISVTLDPSEASVQISDIYEQLTWDAADTVPLVKLPQTIGWERPIMDPDLPLGIASLVVRTLVVLITLATIRSLFLHVWAMRPEPNDSSSDETTAGTINSSSDDTRVQPGE